MSMVQSDQRSFVRRLTELVYLLFGILEAVIGLRVLLKLIGADSNSPFAALVYRVSGLFVWPFSGLTATPAAEGMVLDIPSIIAMLVYALVSWVIVKLIWILLYHPADTAVVSQTTVVRETTPLASTTTQTTTSNTGVNRGP